LCRRNYDHVLGILGKSEKLMEFFRMRGTPGSKFFGLWQYSFVKEQFFNYFRDVFFVFLKFS